MLYNIDKDKIPLLLFKNVLNETPFDIVIENNQIKNINLLIEMMVNLQNNALHNHIIDKHLCTLIEKGIDLTSYLNSSLPISRIRNNNWP
jgi:hypothetical protein